VGLPDGKIAIVTGGGRGPGPGPLTGDDLVEVMPGLYAAAPTGRAPLARG
jgi:hypothetical protein